MGASGGSTAQGMLNNNVANQANTNAQIQAIQGSYGAPDVTNSNTNYVNAVQSAADTGLQQQQQVASRNLNFSMARSGLAGGSEASDANAQLQKEYINGLMQASQQAQGAGANLVASQQAQENALTGLAAGGGQTGAVGNALATSQGAELGNASAASGANALGDVFQGTQQLYQNEQAQAATRQAQASPWGNIYGMSA